MGRLARAEIGLHDAQVARDQLRQPGCNDLAQVHRDQPVDQAMDRLKVVLDHDQRDARSADPLQKFDQRVVQAYLGASEATHA